MQTMKIICLIKKFINKLSTVAWIFIVEYKICLAIQNN